MVQPHERVAAEVRAELARQRISQTQLAERLNISQAGISRRLSGETPFEINELVAIAEFLCVPVARFLPEVAA